MCVQEKKEVRRQDGRIVSEADEISLEVIGRQATRDNDLNNLDDFVTV